MICINDNFNRAMRIYKRVTWPKKGCRYVIRDYVHLKDTPAVVLREIHNVDVVYSDGTIKEAGFWDERFVPATDISELQKLLTSTDREIENA